METLTFALGLKKLSNSTELSSTGVFLFFFLFFFSKPHFPALMFPNFHLLHQNLSLLKSKYGHSEKNTTFVVNKKQAHKRKKPRKKHINKTVQNKTSHWNNYHNYLQFILLPTSQLKKNLPSLAKAFSSVLLENTQDKLHAKLESVSMNGLQT